MTEALHATLADLLPAQLPGIGEALKEGFKGQLHIPGASLLRAEVDRGVRDSLGKVDLYAQFAAAFVWAQDLRAHRADTVDEPASTMLGPQRISLGASPILSVTVNGVTLPPLRTTYAVTASFAGVELQTQRGLLIAMRLGECQLAARLTCGKVELHKPWTLMSYQLPATLPIHPGLQIP